MKTTRLFLKYIVGAGNLNVSSCRIWALRHDGTCDGFKQSWHIAEKQEFNDWYDFIKERNPQLCNRITKVTDGLYRYEGLDVAIKDIVVLYKEEY